MIDLTGDCLVSIERPYARGELDREIVLSRVINAPRDLVYRAWIEPARMFDWFGPAGFRCEVLEQSAAAVGATWRFNMIAPAGQIFSNRIQFLEIIPGERLVYDHSADGDDDPNRFHVTITFDEQADGKTVLTLRQFHPTKDRRAATIGFGAVELGYQTLDKLAAYLARG
jgi:uncharacterized protein YndB with AHSA1/START domain